MVGESFAEKKELKDLQKKWEREWFKTVIEEILIVIAKHYHTGSITMGTILWKKPKRSWNLERTEVTEILTLITPLKKGSITSSSKTKCLRNCVNEGIKYFFKLFWFFLINYFKRIHKRKKKSAVCSLQLWSLW